MEWWVLYTILAVVIAAVVAGYYFLKKRVERKASLQKDLVDKHKITTTILVLDKRMDKLGNAQLPQEVINQIPKLYRFKKHPIVRAKIGPRVMDLLCEKDVYDKLPDKKSARVDLAGIFIAGISKPSGAQKGRR